MNRIVHFEIHAGDPERAAKFYREVFGWEIKKWENPGMEYFMVMTGDDSKLAGADANHQWGGINGGLLRRKGEAPKEGQAVNAFVCTADVENLDVIVEKALKEGGSLALPKQAIPGVGWLAYIKDTEGNILGLMQSDVKAA